MRWLRHSCDNSPRHWALVELIWSCLAGRWSEVEDQRRRPARLWQQEFLNLRLQLDRLNSDFEKTTFLREYTGRLIAIGRPDQGVARRYHFRSFDSLDLSKIYPALKSHELPAECGVTSLFYMKLLSSLGYRAYQYSFGFLEKPYEKLIHSMALVDIEFRGARRLIIQDPYWNLTYHDREGAPIDFFAFLTAIKHRQYEQIATEMSSVGTSVMIADTSLYSGMSDACKAAITDAFTNRDGSRKAEIPIARSYANLMQSSYHHVENAFLEALRQHGLHEPFLYSYTLRVADVAGSRGHGDVQRRIDAILG